MQHHAGGVSGVSMLDGHLEMKTKRWKCYYVQLIGRQLLLFHDLNQPPTLIHIPEEATCKIGKSKRNNFQFSLQADKTRHFRVPSELHRAKWMMHILEASRGDFSPKRQASQRSLYSSLSSAGSWCRYDEGAPFEYLQFCRRSRNSRNSRCSRSTDSSPTEGDLGRRSRITRCSLADCHLPLNNMRWYESAPQTPVPLLTPAPSVPDELEVDPDIISLPDVSAALLQQRKPRQLLQRTGGMENLGALDTLSKCSKFQDLSTLHFSDSSGSPQGDTADTNAIDTYVNFLEWSTYTPASIDALNSSLIHLMEPPRFHRSASLPHSLTQVAGDIYAPQEWVHTRTHPTLSSLSEHSATPQNRRDTNSPLTPDYENFSPVPPEVPERARPTAVRDNLIEVSNQMNISDPELFPPSFNLRRSVLSSITRQNAEEILAGMAPGTFLVRYRETNHHQLALSIRMGDIVLHHCILKEPGGCYAIQGFECHADSLDSLLQAFIRARKGEVSLYCPDEPLSDDDALEWQSNNSVNAIL